jgi:Cu-Zn family superoxide dismutase
MMIFTAASVGGLRILVLEDPMTRIVITIALCCLLATVGVSAQMKHVDLKDAKGNNIGMAMISPARGGGVSIELTLKGLPPGEHGVHLHDVAKCEPPGFKSAGSHFNPTKKQHGMSNPDGPHAGDMPNITAAANGTVQTTITNKNLTMGSEANSIYAGGGTALVIHERADDGKTEPSGNAGNPIACGAITK